MKTLKIVAISILTHLLFCTSQTFSQEESESLFDVWKLYYGQRAYPFDSIPWGAYEHAVQQAQVLRQSQGYMFQSDEWNELGPLPFREQVTFFSGRITNVMYDPSDATGRTIYVTGASGGVWKTTDDGQNWYNKSGDLLSLSAGAFTIDAQRNILYFGSGGSIYNYFGDGRGLRIFKSTNDGINWISISSGLKVGTSVFKIVISPNDLTGNTLFAATFHGLYKTIDGGESWTKIIPELPNEYLICNDVCFSPDRSKVYAVGPSAGRESPWNAFDGIEYWRSVDGGYTFEPITWTVSNFPRNGVKSEKTLCAVSKASNSLVWFLDFEKVDNNTTVYIYKSTNGGLNFHYVHDNKLITSFSSYLLFKSLEISFLIIVTK